MSKKRKCKITDGWIAGGFALLAAIVAGLFQIESIREGLNSLLSGGNSCPPAIGETMHLEPNARTWTQPDVFVGEVFRLVDEDGLEVIVLEGPVLGVVNRNMPEVQANWWKVQARDGELLGWAWQGNMHECVRK